MGVKKDQKVKSVPLTSHWLIPVTSQLVFFFFFTLSFVPFRTLSYQLDFDYREAFVRGREGRRIRHLNTPTEPEG